MKARALALFIAGGLLIAAVPFVRQDSQPLSATVTGVTPADISATLGQRWWSYELRLAKPIGDIRVRIVELRRQSDGGWERTELAPAQAYRHSPADIERIDLKVMIPKDGSGDFVIKLGRNYYRNRFTTVPDVTDMWGPSDAADFVDGCLVLFEVGKDPHTLTGLEADLVRVIGLEIKTGEEIPADSFPPPSR